MFIFSITYLNLNIKVLYIPCLNIKGMMIIHFHISCRCNPYQHQCLQVLPILKLTSFIQMPNWCLIQKYHCIHTPSLQTRSDGTITWSECPQFKQNQEKYSSFYYRVFLKGVGDSRGSLFV